MKQNSHLLSQLRAHWRNSELQQRRLGYRASASGLVALGGGLSLALSAMPGTAQAADITINGRETRTQQIGGNQSLEITDTGSIEVANGSGVIPTGANAAIGAIDNAGSIDVGNTGILIDRGATANAGIRNAAGGLIDAGDTGISIVSSELSGNLSNAGTIQGGNEIENRNDGIGLYSASTLNNDLINAQGGSIDTLTNQGDDGVSVQSNSLIKGNLLNAGKIESANDGISFLSGSIEGAIVNQQTGEILANTNGIAVSATNAAVAIGSISNEGSITATNGDGIYGFGLSSAVTLGNIQNNGSIVTSFDGNGIGVYSGNGGIVVNDIGNDGTITASSSGISLAGGSVGVATSITNAGTLSGGINGIQLAVFQINGDINNAETGEITSSFGNGIFAESSTIAGDLVNQGRLKSSGFDGAYLFNSQIQGQILNQGSISAAPDNENSVGIALLSESSVVGAINNQGDISGNAASILVDQSSGVGGIVNSGDLEGALLLSGTDGLGGGIDVTNSGSIDLGSSESYISGNFTQTAASPDTSLAISLLSFGVYDQAPLRIAGDADIDAELRLSFDSSFALNEATRFTLIDVFSSLTGMFTNYASNSLVRSFGLTTSLSTTIPIK